MQVLLLKHHIIIIINPSLTVTVNIVIIHTRRSRVRKAPDVPQTIQSLIIEVTVLTLLTHLIADQVLVVCRTGVGNIHWIMELLRISGITGLLDYLAAHSLIEEVLCKLVHIWVMHVHYLTLLQAK